MDRRTLIALAAAGLAGCGATGSSSEGPESPNKTDGSATPATAAGSDLSVIAVDAPGTVEVTVPYTFGVRVRNQTDGPAQYASGLSARAGSGWQSLDATVSGRVPAGETARVQGRLSGFPFLGTYGLRLDATGQTWRVESVPRELPFGESFQTPRGLSVTVRGVDVVSTYVGGENGSARTPPSDGQWVVVRVRIINPTGESIQFPPYGAFVLVAGGERYPVAVADVDEPVTIDGDRVRFELPYVVPTGTDPATLAVRWQPTIGGQRTGAVWS
jgi:hypothetical protein